MSRVSVTLINKYYAPDDSATSQLATDLAGHLVARGHEVRVVTSRQLYDDPRAALPARENRGGVQVHRLWSTRFGRASLAGRALDYLSYYLSLTLHLLLRLPRGAVVICCTDPPLVAVPVSLVCIPRRALLINWLQDLYPEVAIRLGVVRESGLVARLTRRLRDGSLRRAACNVAIGESMGRRVEQLLAKASGGLDGGAGGFPNSATGKGPGPAGKRVAVIHNWCDSEAVRPLEKLANPLCRRWGLDSRFVVGYSGNLGKAHEYRTLLEAATSLRAREDITFLVIGRGEHLQRLQSEAAARGLGNFRFEPYQPRDQLRFSLACADLHLVSLRPELEGLILPSKFYGIAAAGRPMVFIGSGEGEVAAMLARHGLGCTVAPAAGNELAGVIRDLAADPDRCLEMGRRARELVDRQLNMGVSLAEWNTVVERVARSRN